MSNTPETDAAELIYDGIVASGYADSDICRKLERERDEAEDKLEVMTAKAAGWKNQAELNAKLVAECLEKAERYRLEANAMMAKMHELQTYADKLADGLPTGMLPRDIENLREANAALAEDLQKVERERDQARRELEIQLESIKFNMERVPVIGHPLRADDASLQDGGAEPQPLREGEPSDFCGAIRRMRYAERERDEAREDAKRLEALCVSVHDRLLRGDNDCDLLNILEEAWKKAARHKEAAK